MPHLRVFSLCLISACVNSSSQSKDSNLLDFPLLSSSGKDDFTRQSAGSIGAVEGFVTDLKGVPIAGVNVSLGETHCISDADGTFWLPEIPIGLQTISFTHPETVLVQRKVYVQGSHAVSLSTPLAPRGSWQSVDAGRRSEVGLGALTLIFEPGDLAMQETGRPAQGSVDLRVSWLAPRSLDTLEAAPLPMEGMDDRGEIVGLESHGILEVELWQGNERVQVREGQTVTTRVALDQEGPRAGEKLPVWHHDNSLAAWVQELDAVVHRESGALWAEAELPHFSRWSFASKVDGVCAQVIVATEGVTLAGLRVQSTNKAGASDSRWALTSTCTLTAKDRYSCWTNLPSGVTRTADPYFKIQAKTSTGAYVDLSGVLVGEHFSRTVMQASDIRRWLTRVAHTHSGSWCGNSVPYSADITGTQNLGNPSPVSDFVRFSVSNSSTAGIGASEVTSDAGFGEMYRNANNLNVNLYSDTDQDGVRDYKDNCLSHSNSSQLDSDKDGVGDDCESFCYVSSSSPDAAWYDYDGDEVDDYCDNEWTRYNPSQYQP